MDPDDSVLANGTGDSKVTARRLHSASTLADMSNADSPTFDPYKALERSQSEAALLKSHHGIFAERDPIDPEGHDLISDGMDHLGHNVSECSKVYLDLSKAEAYESISEHHQASSLFRTGSGRHLETIPQDKELQTDDLVRFSLMSERSVSSESMSSTGSFEERSQRGHSKSYSLKEESRSQVTSSSQKFSKVQKSSSDASNKNKGIMKSTFHTYSLNLKQKIKQLQMGSIQEQIHAMRDISTIIDQAWAIPSFGRDLAYSLCDILREDKALDMIVKNCASQTNDLMRTSAKLLEKILTTDNRKRVAEIGLEIVTKMAINSKGETEMARVVTGILENLFKTSEDVCAKLTALGGLDVIVYWCRCNDRLTLRHCAIAVANMALYGGRENQEEMTRHKVPEWLFPLAFNDDDTVRYYACLAIAVLVANKEIENVVQNSGTLEVVLPFITTHTPDQFARVDLSHRHGRSKGWLKRLVSLLYSKREEAQALAAFHFAMEAGIKAEQGKKQILYEIDAIEPLKRLASSPNATTSKLAGEALKIVGEDIPHKLSQQVPLWAVDDVVFWVTQVGYGEFAEKFRECKVDGDLLLTLSTEELAESIDMKCKIMRKRFLRDLKELKITADYSSSDPSDLNKWLADVCSEFSQYTYPMLQCGVDRNFLLSLSDSDLLSECGVKNGIHRKRLMHRIEDLKDTVDGRCSALSTEGSISMSKSTDVFISYRRINGSQLASLLKVHLQLRGFSVFLDIEKLRAGKFDENLLNSVKMARHFILVLTPDALDRCIGDNEQKDWVHKEIVAALECGCNIIPLMDNFSWPPPEKLPEDMRQISYFNGIRWIHDYQDACVEKLERFLRGELNMKSRRAGLFQMGSSSEGMVGQESGRYSSSESESPSSEAVSPNKDISSSS